MRGGEVVQRRKRWRVVVLKFESKWSIFPMLLFPMKQQVEEKPFTRDTPECHGSEST